MRSAVLTAASALLFLAACQQSEPPAPAAAQEAAPEPAAAVQKAPAEQPSRYDIYAEVRLSADLSHLDENQRQMIALLIEASKIMDGLFWLQAFGEPEPFLAGVDDPAQKRFAAINYGPWDRLAADQPFVESDGAKPLGATWCWSRTARHSGRNSSRPPHCCGNPRSWRATPSSPTISGCAPMRC
jgi:hypothetical protein